MTTLYIVSTPIGNLDDVTQRALWVLKSVSLILCEDTRVTRKLLEHFDIHKQLLSFHQHSRLRKLSYILDLLKRGKSLALVSDAGTPGISDPGGKLIEAVIENLGDEVKISPIPGPSALTAAASISGFPMDRFLFLGFPPKKRKRSKFLRAVLESKYPVIFYESPYRIIKTLEELQNYYNELPSSDGGKPDVVVCRELTKKFETVYRGEVANVIEKIKNDKIKGNIKGEFVVIWSHISSI